MHSLKARYAGQVKLIYIDPPYNTDRDEFRYNDRFSQSSWLTFLENRLSVAKGLLQSDGVIILQIGDHRVAEAKLVMDGVFGRENFINQVTTKTRSPSGFKTVNLGVFESAEYLLIYGKDKRQVVYEKQYQVALYDNNYRFAIDNITANCDEWIISDIKESALKELGSKRAGLLLEEVGDRALDGIVSRFALENSSRVFRLTAINDDASIELRDLREKSKTLPEKVFQFKGPTERVFVRNGQQLAFYNKKIREIDGIQTPTNILTNIWQDIAWEGIASEGGVKLKQGKKPERLIRRLLKMYTCPTDRIADFFLGSGTTAAVSHKMGRRYIGIEQLDYGKNSAMDRLKKVISGEQSGVSKLEAWSGGGSFIHLELTEWNEALGGRIRDAADEASLETAVTDLKANGYWHYAVDQTRFDWDAFAALPFDERKQILLDSLDANHLYVNYGDIADEAYDVSDADIAVNRAFYGDAA